MAESLQYEYNPQPHPYLSEPILYISNIPSQLTDHELAVAFEFCVPFRPRIPRDGTDKLLSGVIEFKSLDKAEKALATLQGRPIPGSVPPILITLSPFPPEQNRTLPAPSATARLVKQLPEGFKDSELYDLFRPYGPLASVRASTSFAKDTGIVEFWREDDAKIAEENLHCAEVGDKNIAVQVYHHGRAGSGARAEFNVTAPAFVPSGSVLTYPQQTSPPSSYPSSPRRVSAAFIHGPGQQVQFAPLSGPGSNSHSGLIDPCNLFCKNLDPDIDSNALFSHFRAFGQIVSARVMRDEGGRSRGFGFVSFQTPDQAAHAMHSMNGAMLGKKQIVVRLHEPKQLRQEKLAARFGTRDNGHPRSRSGATSPTASEGGDSFSGWPSPRGSYTGLGSPSSAYSPIPERARRSSGSYYNAALAGHLNIPMTFEDLSALSPVVRREVVTGELARRVRNLANSPNGENIPVTEIESIVDTLANLHLGEVVDVIQDPSRLADRVKSIRTGSTEAEKPAIAEPIPERASEVTERTRAEAPSPAASADSRVLDPAALAATASAPEHPSTPVSLSTQLSTPPRTESPAGPAGASSASLLLGSGAGLTTTGTGSPSAGASERDRLFAAVRAVPGVNTDARASDVTELLMSLSKRERALCLFSGEVLRQKVADALAVLDADDETAESAPVAPAAPVTPVKKVPASSSAGDESPQTPALSSRGPSAAASPAAPQTPPPVATISATGTTYTIESLARLPASKILELVRQPSTAASLGLPEQEDPLVVRATDDFVDGLAGQPVPRQKQQVGDKLFRVIKAFGIKGAPKVTIALLDQDDLRPLAHLMNSYPSVLKEKALLVQAAASK